MDAAFQELLDEFLLEAQERIDVVESTLLSIRDGVIDEAGLTQLRRELHTLKGNAGMMGFTDLQAQAHTLEDQVEALDAAREAGDGTDVSPMLAGIDALRARLLERVQAAAALAEDADDPFAAPGDTATAPARDETATDEPTTSDRVATRDGSVRVPFGKIDQLVEMLAEALIFRNRLNDAIDAGRTRAAAPDDDPLKAATDSQEDWEQVDVARQDLDKTLNQVQSYVTELGMVPLRTLFRSLRRVVHDESRRAGKIAQLVIAGGDTPIDRALLETAAEALGHLVRNAVIHGLEDPDVRRQAGKGEQGTIRLSAAIEGGEVRIEVADDGAGIDLDALRALAPGAGNDEAALLAVLFEEGVSTRGAADLSSGRGVGLAAVKQSVEGANGRVEVRSRAGRGSTFALRLPLTASIIRSILVSADDERYALPLVAVEETVTFGPDDVHHVNHALVLRQHEHVTPLVDLGVAFETAATPRRSGYAVVVSAAGRRRAVAVDGLVGIHDIVVKLLDPIVGQPLGISGSTILGDGRVIMILDPASLVTIPPFLPATR